jgi:hypothetical protein
MKEPTETTGWVVIVLLAIAAIIVNTSFGSTNLGVILVTILAAICGRLVLRYQ